MSPLGVIGMQSKRFAKDVLLRPVVVRRRPGAAGLLALTFDDGPNPRYTPRVLEVLDRYRAKATFFCVGQNLIRYPEIAQAICDRGHEIGNHSMTHAEFASIDYRQIEAELDSPLRILGKDGQPWIAQSAYFRPPKGIINAKVLRYCIARKQRIVYWNRDPKDYEASSAQQIVDCFAHSGPDAGDIVLLHDKTPHTVEALDELLARAQHAGLASVAVRALLSH
jgi:peptidoglycan-N-acetylglucosamine deacetylase